MLPDAWYFFYPVELLYIKVSYVDLNKLKFVCSEFYLFFHVCVSNLGDSSLFV